MAAIKISPEREQELAERAGKRDSWYSRDHACRRVGCSVKKMSDFEASGEVATKREGHRVWLASKDVERLVREWVPKKSRKIERVDSRVVESNTRGKVAARCFPYFQKGASFDEIVIATEIDPVMVAEAWRDWQLKAEGILSEREKGARADAQREEQRRHDKIQRDQTWREHQLKLAKMGVSTRKLSAIGTKVGSEGE